MAKTAYNEMNVSLRFRKERNRKNRAGFART